jgi:hypothetical protein
LEASSRKRSNAFRIGGYALDGCVFLLADIERVVESLKCFACNVPQNFHHQVVAFTL